MISYNGLTLRMLEGWWIPIYCMCTHAPQAQDQAAFFMCLIPSTHFREYREKLDEKTGRFRSNVDPPPNSRQIKTVRNLQSKIPRSSFLLLTIYYAAQAHIKWLQLQDCQVSWIKEFGFQKPILEKITEVKCLEPFRYFS